MTKSKISLKLESGKIVGIDAEVDAGFMHPSYATNYTEELIANVLQNIKTKLVNSKCLNCGAVIGENGKCEHCGTILQIL